MLTDKQIKQINTKAEKTQEKIDNTKNQFIKDGLTGYILGLQWCKENL